MQVHNWTRVFPGTFHDFHCAWITHLKETLNSSVLPTEFFALAEQHAGEIVPDVLTLSRLNRPEANMTGGGLLVADAPPQVSICMDADEDRLFLSVGRYVNVPLADTYSNAFQGMPGLYRDILEGKSPPESPD